jgi:hypothetical protein
MIASSGGAMGMFPASSSFRIEPLARTMAMTAISAISRTTMIASGGTRLRRRDEPRLAMKSSAVG